MTNLKVLKVFIASPSDVAAERNMVRKVVNECNISIGEPHNIRVEVVGWETDIRPSWGKDAQSFINDLAERNKYALFVVIFWKRFGTPTPRSKSGTFEEFQNAIKRRAKSSAKRPEIMLYFNVKQPPIATHAESLDYSQVLAFRESITEGLYGTYKGKLEFENKFRSDYARWLNDEIGLNKKPVSAKRSAKTSANQSKGSNAGGTATKIASVTVTAKSATKSPSAKGQQRNFCVNVGQSDYRNWEDCRKYGFISAGGGRWYIRTLENLKPGDRIFVYVADGTNVKKGIAGVGIVKGPSVPAASWNVRANRPLLHSRLKASNMNHDAGDLQKCEYVVPVKWLASVPFESRYINSGVRGNQNTVITLSDKAVIKKILRHFGLDENAP